MSTMVAGSAGVSISAAAAAANAANIAAQQQKKREKIAHEYAVNFVSPYRNCPSNADDPQGYKECVALIGAPEHEPSAIEAVGFVSIGLIILFGAGFLLNKFCMS